MRDNRHRLKPKKKKMRISTYTVENKETFLLSLIASFPHKSRNTLKAVLRDGQVTIDGKPVTQFDHILKPGQCVEVSWDRIVPLKQPRELDIIFEDQDIIIINKPSGLLTIATEKEKRKTAYSMLSNYVKTENPDNKIFIIHRIDRETSGLLMFAKNEKVKQQIQKTWATSISQRTYIGVVEGNVKKEQGTIISWLTESKAFKVYSSKKQDQGQKAITHYKKIKANDTYSLLQINLETGRKHQIRVHMQDINHSIIGDKKYGASLNPIRRMGLHAQVLAFTHPTSGEQCYFETPIPHKFLALFSS